MTNAQKVKQALTYANMSTSELARKMGVTPQALSQRLKTDKFSTAELERIGEILGASYHAVFEFPDGTVI
ncbi:MAG: helix-turn-helix transcriptional regulator [Erysipelotrichaceae bacterium]|nr:helix-turn-helix transcriptional regulator [Erysipelotrichaceae bacterium]MCI9523927.1 helix-turn-helix transcriptional regulator [Erysipelotrichaceae bacterium]